MDTSFSNKVALVTGAASGIGLSTAQAFSRAGARVVLADVTVDAGENAVRNIKESGGEALFVRTDVSKAAEVEALVRKTVDTWGRLDCAVNNAGIEGVFAPTAECTEENWDRVISINLKGCHDRTECL
jgi:NAD(P)-dependent dehydrogenase (short-subunit alcohol dehydrogenase family)